MAARRWVGKGMLIVLFWMERGFLVRFGDLARVDCAVDHGGGGFG